MVGEKTIASKGCSLGNKLPDDMKSDNSSKILTKRLKRKHLQVAINISILPGEHGKIWDRLEVGWEKVVCWSTKAAISLKHVKIEEKLLRRAYRNSPMLFQTVPSQSPYGLLFLKIAGSQPPPKTSIAIIARMGTATDFNLADTFTGSI